MPQYQVWIQNASYGKLAYVSRYVKLTYVQALNEMGWACLEMPPESAQIAEMTIGRRLQIVRDGAIVFGGQFWREGWKKPEEAPAGETWAIWALDHARYAGIAAGDYVTLKLLREGGNANDTVNDSVYLKGWLVSYTADM